MSAEYRRLGLMLTALLLIACGAFAASYTVARADGGEAALVIQQEGRPTDTYCVGFSGDSISASDLLAKAGYPVVQFDGLVCAVGADNGCFMPSSQSTCVCHSYAPENKYWSFFVKRHGKAWQYAPFGINDSRAALKDGDMEAWKWGVASPNSAPAPDSSITFESVCGHAPRGGAAEPATAVQPTATTPAPTTSAALAPTQAATVPPTVATLTATNAPASTATGVPTLTDENTPLIRNHGTATAVVQAPATGGTGGGGSTGQLYAFIAIAGSLVATIVAALIWGRRRGA
jgi:hypothetical protein